MFLVVETFLCLYIILALVVLGMEVMSKANAVQAMHYMIPIQPADKSQTISEARTATGR